MVLVRRIVNAGCFRGKRKRTFSNLPDNLITSERLFPMRFLHLSFAFVIAFAGAAGAGHTKT